MKEETSSFYSLALNFIEAIKNFRASFMNLRPLLNSVSFTEDKEGEKVKNKLF